jgi:hypothetical protein
MKYLENEKLTKLTQELTDVVCGTRVINGRIEAYTCKRAGSDKKYAHSLAERYESEVVSSSAHQVSFESCSPYANGSLGNFQESSTRKLLTDLILTLNASFPDYDFGNVKPGQFQKIASTKIAISRANQRLSELAQKKSPGFLNLLWCSVDEVISLKHCTVYSFNPDEEGTDDGSDPYMETSTGSIPPHLHNYNEDEGPELGAALWSFNYFFVNKALKRILFFTCVQSCLREVDSGNEQDSQDYFQPMLKSDELGQSQDEDESTFDFDVDIVDQPAVSTLYA